MLRVGLAIGRDAAHDAVYECAMAAHDGKGRFRDLLLADPRIAEGVGADAIDQALRPEGYVGLAGAFVDRVVAEARLVVGEDTEGSRDVLLEPSR
jgi:3-carboxy-cis,cis-muconate cycloisomerase